MGDRWVCDTCPFTTSDPMAREGHEHHAPVNGWLGRNEQHHMVEETRCVCGHTGDAHNDYGCLDCGSCMEWRPL